MSGLASELENYSISDDLKAYITGLVDQKIQRALNDRKVGDRLIPRSLVVAETSRRIWDYGVEKKLLNPLSIDGRNAKQFVFRSEYEAFLRHLQIQHNS
jgi:hypothetical protein